MWGQRAISGRRLRGVRLLAAGALVFLSAAVFAGHVRAANWSHPTISGHPVATGPVVTTGRATVTGSGAVSVPGLTVKASITATDVATTTTTTTVNANGSTTTTTTTTYAPVSSLTGITVTGTYTVAGSPPTSNSFSFFFPALPQAVGTALANGYDLTLTPIANTNTIAIGLSPAPDVAGPTATGTLTLGAPMTTTSSTPAPAPPTPFTPSHGPQGPTASAVAEAAQAAADETLIEIARCNNQTPPCVADALFAYAAKLEKIAPQLPPKMRALPGIIRQAARKVRAAKSPAEAVRAVQTAIVQVRHTVELLRAEDPDARALGGKVGDEAVGVLQAASEKLERATEL